MRVASYNSYRRIRRIHVDPALGQVLAGKLTRAQLSTYYAAKMRGSKKTKPLAETTVAHHHAMLKTAYNWALEEELLLVNPALRVKNPPALRPKTRPVWSMGEIASTVIKARGLQVHAAGVLAGFSGLRVGEIAGLLWSDLDLTRGFVTVTRTVEEDDDGTLLEYPPKNGKARTVPLPAAACDELRVWLAAQKEYRLAQGPAWNEAGRVVPKKDGTQMAPSTLKSQWWNWVARQKIDPHLPIHGLRDSFGTWVYETYGVKQAQEWLGHSDPATTLRHYVRLTTAARAKAVAGLDEVTRAALEHAEEKVLEDAQPAATTSSRSPAVAGSSSLSPSACRSGHVSCTAPTGGGRGRALAPSVRFHLDRLDDPHLRTAASAGAASRDCHSRSAGRGTPQRRPSCRTRGRPRRMWGRQAGGGCVRRTPILRGRGGRGRRPPSRDRSR